MSVRPEFGPTLPDLLRGRFGLSPWVAAALLAVVLAAGLVVVLNAGDTAGGRADLVHRERPSFNLLYDDALVRAVAPRRGELARLEARPRRARATVTVRRLADSPLVFGALPVYAEHRIAALREELGELRLREEGKARIWGHPGYRLDYRAGRIAGSDVLLFPDEAALRGGALVSFRQVRGGRKRPRDRAAVAEVRRVLRSFQFGADRR